jgi:tetratricopeptide (TPR) repeat protein
MALRFSIVLCGVACLTPTLGPALRAQVLEVRPATPPPATASIEALRASQEGFESFRRRNAPVFSVRSGPDRCDERVGRFCYWYEEDSPDPPHESERITEARNRLIQLMDSVGREYPNDRWVSGQRVRYLTEAGRYNDAVDAAKACTSREWWCEALRGFAFHVAGRFEEADSSYERALRLMTPTERCTWRDMKLLLNDEQLKWYREQNCTRRLPVEERVWWLSRPLLSGKGNDARTEYYSRLMMARFVEDAPSAYAMGFDFDERELTLRYGWPIAWTRNPSGGLSASGDVSLVGHERTPAHPFLPAPGVLDNPASSDSAGWRSKGIPPVRARYAPVYAKRLLPLEHQSALFRRGDSALVIAAWSIARDAELSSAADEHELKAAMVLTRGEEKDVVVVRSDAPERRGAFMARSAWGSTLMSVEVLSARRHTLARARYGVRRTDTPESRIQVSDIVLFDPYDGMPTSAEDVLPHMRTSERLPVGSRVGIFWEAYNTDPTGEGIEVNITVAPEGRSGNWLSRGLRALRRVREAQPVTVGMRDVSARGSAITARAVEVDLATLTPGRYLLQLELNAGQANVVRVERAITIVAAGSG